MAEDGVRERRSGRMGRIGRREAIAVAALLAVLAVAVATAFVILRTPGPRGEFTVVTGRDASRTGIYAALIDEWNACHAGDGPQARLIELSGITDLQRADMLRQLQSDGPGYDVLNLDTQWIAEFARAGHIAALGDDVDTSGLLRNILDATSYEGDTWAVPFIADAGLLFFRSDLVDREDLEAEGQDWGDTLAVLRDAAEETGRNDDHGYAGQLSAYEGLTVNALEVANVEGHGLVDDQGSLRADLTGTSQRAALRLIADRLATGAIHPESLDDTEIDSADRFTAGEVIAMRNWPVWYDDLAERPGVRPVDELAGREDRGEDPDGGEIEFGVLPLPDSSAVLGGQSLAVADASPHRDAAIDLIEFLTAPEQQRRLFHTAGYAPVREDAYHGEVAEGVRSDCDPDGGPTAGVEERRGAYADLLLDSVRGARARPPTPYYQRFSQTFYTGLHPLLKASARGENLHLGELADLEGRLQNTLSGH
ncbi:extracellular solute-binding protein [Nocardiopsis mangrovi]|uniref:Extracellular solute-binding protein n=1 Tax=Nocardiopsis mangrovi TaxID=1179818 RepID=A0ABV9DW50_9ACTN